MIKHLIITASLSLPLLAMAADAPAAPAAPASAAQTGKAGQVELKAQQNRGAKMGACQKQADDQGLNGLERKKFVGECVRG